MGAKVYANGNEIMGKAGGGNVIAAFPDVCLSPPSPPAGPVPIPYPVSSTDSDTVDGSKTVKAGGQELMLKDKSSFKKCTGDEPATKNLGQGTVTHTLTGSVYFIAWSMDVEIEGENVVRHLDATTSNHGSKPGNAAVPQTALKTRGSSYGTVDPSPEKCKQVLVKYPVESYDKQKGKAPKGFQSHHVLQNCHFQTERGKTDETVCKDYQEGLAPCLILEGSTELHTPHGWVSKMQRMDGAWYARRLQQENLRPTYKEARMDAFDQLTNRFPVGPALKPVEAECVLREVDKQMAKLCKPGSLLDRKLRVPREKPPVVKRRDMQRTNGRIA